ncbi:transcription factor, contains a PHD finger motif [Elasticomyces elasticus]|nr:transcription factor, contains a PHD finger motif [Elasticomyces elasticus]
MADPTPSLQPFLPLPTNTNTPLNPSPLNPRAPSRTPAPPPPPREREQREKKDSLKKRESNPNPNGTLKRKASAPHAFPSPQRFNVPPPKPSDFDPPKDDIMISHEPHPLEMPDGERQLYKPIELAENKRGYRYGRAIADPLFPHKQHYRSTSPPPHYARLSFEDADRWMHFTTNALITTNEKGWRMVRSNVCAREGTTYYEIRIHRGVPPTGPSENGNATAGPNPHVRFGFARREAPLDSPVGFDGYSYGITDLRFETMHRSRPGKFFHPVNKKSKSKGASSKFGPQVPTPVQLAAEDLHVKEGDIIGLELQLPSLNLHQKIVSGVYNPAVDVGDGFDQPSYYLEPGAESTDIIRDRIPVAYKGNTYFETLDHVASKAMEVYADRQTNLTALNTALTNQATASKDVIKTPPNPNHEHASLRTLPGSAMRVYKNGVLVGTAFEGLLAFLPPASAPSKTMGAREGFDDGLVGYFPAVSCFWGGVVECNFGDGREGFWCPPPHLVGTVGARGRGNGGPAAILMGGGMDGGVDGVEGGLLGVDASGGKQGFNPGRVCRGIGERYREQIAEDVVWDLVDEVDFYMQDGGVVPGGEGVGGEGGGVKVEGGHVSGL